MFVVKFSLFSRRRIALLFLGLLGAQVIWAQSARSPDAASQTQEAVRAGLTLVKEKRFDEAIHTFEAGLNSDRQNPLLLNAIGSTYALKNDSEQARKYFLQCLNVDPQFIPARKNLAISYFTSGEYTLAVPELNRLLDAADESRRTAQLFLGIIDERQKQYDKSISMLLASGDLLYRYPEALVSLAHSYSELKEFQRSAAALRHLDALSGVTTSEYFQAGIFYSQFGQNRRAIAEFDKVQRAVPDFPGLAYQRANVLYQLGRSREALKILEASTKVNADSNSLNLLARIAEENRDFALAFQSLRLAAKLDPEKEENYLDFSTLCVDHRNYSLALQSVDIGLSHIPNSYRLQVQRGAVLEKLERFDQAEEVLRKASQLQPDNSEALLSLGIVQAHAGALQDAVGTLSAAIGKFPSNYYMHYYLGNVLSQIDRQDNPDGELDKRAEQELKESIRLNSSFADSYYQLSKLYLHKAPKLAEQNLIECLKRNPNHASAEYALGRLYVETGRQSEGQKLIARFQAQQRAAKLDERNKPGIEAAQP
jgi:tetratricopeptide (TPR) repeat protein